MRRAAASTTSVSPANASTPANLSTAAASSTPGSASAAGGTVVDALQLVLATEHAAVYGYPMLGVRLTDSAQVQRARELEAAHRHARDEVMAQLARLGVAPVAAQPTYPSAERTTGTTAATEPAIRSAVAIEERRAGAYRYLLTAAVTADSTSQRPAHEPDAHQPVRIQAMTGLASAAANSTGWRSLIAPAKPTLALPGL